MIKEVFTKSGFPLLECSRCKGFGRKRTEYVNCFKCDGKGHILAPNVAAVYLEYQAAVTADKKPMVKECKIGDLIRFNMKDKYSMIVKIEVMDIPCELVYKDGEWWDLLYQHRVTLANGIVKECHAKLKVERLKETDPAPYLEKLALEESK